MPLLLIASVALIVLPGVPGASAEMLEKSLGAPATTFERPRGTSMNGKRSVCWSVAWPAAGVATTSPRTVNTEPGPIEKVSSEGSAANAAADMVSETWTGDVAPAATDRLAGEKLMTAPRRR